MRVKREVLLEVIDDAIERVKAANKEYEDNWPLYLEDHFKRWQKTQGPVWTQYLKKLTALLNAGKPITQEDVVKALEQDQHDRWNSPRYPYYSQPSDTKFEFKGKKYERIQLDLRIPQIRKVLETIEDESISTSSLRDLGYRNMEWLFRQAVI